VNLTFSNAGQSYSVPINNVLLDGVTVGDANADAEPVLDIVQAIGMAPGLSQVRVYLGNNQADIFNAMATENIAKQLSVSYIWEPDDFSTLDPIFEEFLMQGQTLFASSGDNGAYQPSEPQYYPAEDVYVTATGGTSLTTNGAGGSWNSEIAWTESGGGVGPIPYVISIPVWQQGVANSSNGGSATLRNVPDVAADADFNNYNCQTGSCSGGWGGTSFAAPRWAGYMALVNQQAAAQGKPTLGFIDPAIYSIGQSSSYGSDFHDITSGNNDSDSQPVWYYAVPGYDLVTGWGSPNGQNLINALAGGFTLSASPSSLTITQGGSGTTTITVTEVGGFVGEVTLAASGAPSGVTASYSPNPTTGTSTLTLTASNSATPGTATVTITGTSDGLAAITNLVLKVNPHGGVQQSITFGALLNVTYGVSPITLTATASSTLPVSYTVTGPATVTGSILSITGAGLVTVTANQAGNSNFAAAPAVSQSFTVVKAGLTATANSLSRSAGAANPTLTYAIKGFVNDDTVAVVGGSATLTTTATTSSPAGSYPITFATEALTAANYAFTYKSGTLTVTAVGVPASPSFSPAGGTYTTAQVVTLTDATMGASIYYKTSGMTPTLYTGPIRVATTETIEAAAVLNGVPSTVVSATYTIETSTQCNLINYANGFNSTGLTLNNGATVTGNLLQLTDGMTNEARSAFFTTAVPVTSFVTDFTFQLLNPVADGFAFVIQRNDPKEVGAGGGGLGYAGIPNSGALKFDLYNNAGEGPDSTGLYLNGAFPSVPDVNLAGTGIDLHSGHILAVHLSYDGALLSVTITDTVTSAAYKFSAAEPSTPGEKAFVGFTGGTGSKTSEQNILTWTYSAGESCGSI